MVREIDARIMSLSGEVQRVKEETVPDCYYYLDSRCCLVDEHGHRQAPLTDGEHMPNVTGVNIAHLLYYRLPHTEMQWLSYLVRIVSLHLLDPEAYIELITALRRTALSGRWPHNIRVATMDNPDELRDNRQQRLTWFTLRHMLDAPRMHRRVVPTMAGRWGAQQIINLEHVLHGGHTDACNLGAMVENLTSPEHALCLRDLQLARHLRTHSSVSTAWLR